MAHWSDLVRFEVVEVMASAEAAAAVLGHRLGRHPSRKAF
jgi:hypothetical protein